MSDYAGKMQQLRSEIPQGSTIEKRKKSDQEGFKRMESSPAFPTSDRSTGKTETPGDLGEVAYPQSDRMDAEEALLNKLASTMEARPPAATTNTTKPTKQSTKVAPTTPKHTRSNYAPHTGSKTRRPHGTKGPVLDTLKNYKDKQTDEYFSIAKEVIPAKDYQDFSQNYEAQVKFAEDAAVQSFHDKLDGGKDYTTQVTKLPDGSRLDTITFEDGSKYYTYPDVNVNEIGPGDVIRLEPPEDKK
tara:strand:+ start:3283 stop:4014 length:732 start_codon:yes stop_codon:yes gene_type:complete